MAELDFAALALRGELEAALESASKTRRQAAIETVREVNNRVKLGVRREVRRVFTGKRNKRGGSRLENTIRGREFLRDADGPAAITYSKFGRKIGGVFVGYFATFTKGGKRRPKISNYFVVNAPGVTSRRVERAMNDLETNKRILLIPFVSRDGYRLVRKTKRKETLLAFLVTEVEHDTRFTVARVHAKAVLAMPRILARKLARGD